MRQIIETQDEGRLVKYVLGTSLGIFLLAGCHFSQSTAPESRTEITRPGATLAGQAPLHPRIDPYLMGLVAYLDQEGLRIEARIGTQSPGAFELSWSAQAYLDTDSNPSTGYGAGFELVGRVLENERADTGYRFPVRTATPSDDIYAGGWGPITGWGLVDLRGRVLVATIPYEALGNDRDGMVLRFVLSREREETSRATVVVHPLGAGEIVDR